MTTTTHASDMEDLYSGMNSGEGGHGAPALDTVDEGEGEGDDDGDVDEVIDSDGDGTDGGSTRRPGGGDDDDSAAPEEGRQDAESMELYDEDILAKRRLVRILASEAFMDGNDAVLTLTRSLLTKELLVTPSKPGIASGSAINSAISYCAFCSLVDAYIKGESGEAEEGRGDEDAGKKKKRTIVGGHIIQHDEEEDRHHEDDRRSDAQAAAPGATLRVPTGVTSITIRLQEMINGMASRSGALVYSAATSKSGVTHISLTAKDASVLYDTRKTGVVRHLEGLAQRERELNSKMRDINAALKEMEDKAQRQASSSGKDPKEHMNKKTFRTLTESLEECRVALDDVQEELAEAASKARHQKQSSPDLRLRIGAAPYVPALARIPRNPQALRSAFAPDTAVNLASNSPGDDRFTSFDVLSQAVILRREADWDPPRCVREALHRTLIPNPSGRLLVTQIPDMPGPQVIIQTFRNLQSHRAVVLVCDSCTPTHTVCEYPLGMSLRAFVFGISLEPAHLWAAMTARMLSYTCTADYRPVACTQALPADADVVQLFVTTTIDMYDTSLHDMLPITGLPLSHEDISLHQPGGPRPPVPPIPPLGRRWGTTSVFGLLGPDDTLTIPTQASPSVVREAAAPFDAAGDTFVVFDEYLHMRILELPPGATAHQLVDIAYANTAQLPLPRGHRFLHHAIPGLPPIQLCVWGQLAVDDIVLPFLTQDARRPVCTTRVVKASTPFEAALEVESACGYGPFLHQGLQRRQIHLSVNGHPVAPHSKWVFRQFCKLWHRAP